MVVCDRTHRMLFVLPILGGNQLIFKKMNYSSATADDMYLCVPGPQVGLRFFFYVVHVLPA